ncbi:RcnB family protein [Sphingomonas sp.]|uniref:RcnB family protein n=1 Tax=Sphingomonas sp. TaxID=28214 RepID=UPI002ED7E532
MSRTWGRRAGAAMFAMLLSGAAGAQTGRYGAVPDVPLNPAGGGWTGQGWTGPEARGVRDLRPDPRADVRGPGPRASDLRVREDRAPPPPYRGRYVRPYPGWTLPSYFTAPPFAVRDYPRWGLGVPGIGRRWVRYYEDAVLVGPDGRVDAVRSGIDWARGDAGPAGRDWSDDRVTDGGRRGGYAPGTIVTTTTPGTVTTTTVTEEYVPGRAPKRTVRTKTRTVPAGRRSI